MQTLVQFLRSQTVLVVSAVLALVSCFLVPPSLSYVSYVDWRVLGLLFSLMAVVAGLRTAGTFRVLTEFLLRKVNSMRVIALLLVLLCFGFSMFLTNDVTLITLVPFTLLVFRQMTGSEKALVHTLVLETLAANLGSMLTPIGNPQNLYLYSQYDLSLGTFFRTMAPYTALSLMLLVVLTLVLVPGGAASLSEGRTFHSFHRKTFFVYAALFLLCLLSVARVLDWRVLLVAVLAVVVIENYRLLRMVDYSLLLTFVFFLCFHRQRREPAGRAGVPRERRARPRSGDRHPGVAGHFERSGRALVVEVHDGRHRPSDRCEPRRTGDADRLHGKPHYVPAVRRFFPCAAGAVLRRVHTLEPRVPRGAVRAGARARITMGGSPKGERL